MKFVFLIINISGPLILKIWLQVSKNGASPMAQQRLPASAGSASSIPGSWEKIPGGGHSNHPSILAWRLPWFVGPNSLVLRCSKSWTWLNDLATQAPKSQVVSELSAFFFFFFFKLRIFFFFFFFPPRAFNRLMGNLLQKQD